MKTEVYDFKVPEFLICPLWYGDTSGLTKEDELILETAVNQFNELSGDKGHWSLDIKDEQKYFTLCPDFTNLGCDVYDCSLTIFFEEE